MSLEKITEIECLIEEEISNNVHLKESNADFLRLWCYSVRKYHCHACNLVLKEFNGEIIPRRQRMDIDHRRCFISKHFNDFIRAFFCD